MDYIKKKCNKHGITDFYFDINSNTYRCSECRKQNVSNKRRKNKRILVEYKGGKCEKCGYDKCIDALEFHHIDPKTKDFGISNGNTISIDKLKKEVDKCILVCSNCHKEIHYNLFIEKQKEIENQISNNLKENDIHIYNKPNINDINEIKKLISMGKNRNEICDIFNFSLTTYNRFCVNNNITNNISTSKLSFYNVEILKEDLKELNSFVKIGEKYNVSDNAIKKWCNRNGLPKNIKELKKYFNI